MEASASFWERRPWLGAAVFGSVVIGVGIFLAATVGERPHYRATWPLVTELPSQGRVVAPDRQSDPVRVQVRLRVADPAGRGQSGVEAILARRETGEVISRGITSPPEGHLLLPVPASLDGALFRGQLDVVALAPGTGGVKSPAPSPNRGESVALVTLEGTTAVEAAVVDEKGEPLDRPGTVFVVPSEMTSPDHRSAGWPLRKGRVLIGGLPADPECELELRLAGHERSRTPLRAAAGKEPAPVVKLVPGAPLALVTGTVTADGRTLARAPMKITVDGQRERRAWSHSRTLRTDAEGRFRLRVAAATDVRLRVSALDGEEPLGATLTGQDLNPGATWDTGTIVLDLLPILASGVVTRPDGEPAAGALVSLEYRDLDGTRATSRGPTTTAGEDGRFVLRGPKAPGRIAVSAYGDGTAVRVPAGSAPPLARLELTLAPTGALAGSLAVESAGADVFLFLVMPGAPEAGALHFHVARRGAPRREFKLEGLPAGSYDLLFRRSGEKVQRVTKIRVEPGRVAADPRLAQLTVR